MKCPLIFIKLQKNTFLFIEIAFVISKIRDSNFFKNHQYFGVKTLMNAALIFKTDAQANRFRLTVGVGQPNRPILHQFNSCFVGFGT